MTYDKFMGVHYSCVVCRGKPGQSPYRSVRYMGEDGCRMCDECFVKELEVEKKLGILRQESNK